MIEKDKIMGSLIYNYYDRNTKTQGQVELQNQPYMDVLEKISAAAKRKNISSPFSAEDFTKIRNDSQMSDLVTTQIASLFRGNENLRDTYIQVQKNNFDELRQANSSFGFKDANGDLDRSLESYGISSPAAGFNALAPLNPIVTASYLAKTRNIEFFNVVHSDKPTWFREYNLDYAVDAERNLIPFPQAIRDGALGGLLDLPVCEPLAGDGDLVRNIIGCKHPTNGKSLNFVKLGSSGKLLQQAGLREEYSLERSSRIDYIAVLMPTTKYNDGKDEWEYDKTGMVTVNLGTKAAPDEKQVYIIPKYIENNLKTGASISEVLFSEVVSFNLPIKRTVGTEIVYSKARFSFDFMAKLNLSTSEYVVMNSGDEVSKLVVGVHFDAKVTNVPNDMKTITATSDKIMLKMDIENHRYGEIPVVPEMEADFNAGGEGVTWVAYMTDILTQTISGVRDKDLLDLLDASFELDIEDFRLYRKLGGFKVKAPFDASVGFPAITGDPNTYMRNALRDFTMKILTRGERSTNFDNQIARQWIMMANDEDAMYYLDNPTHNDKALMSEGSTNVRYGFSCDDIYGFADSVDRRIRIIGSRDNYWVDRPITAVLKTTTVAAPTTMYFPYSVRILSGISPTMTNRPAILFMIRDAKTVATMVQCRFSIQNAGIDLYAKQANFAAGFPKKGQPDTVTGYTYP